MDDSLTDLELELRRLRPAKPSNLVMTGIARELQVSPARFSWKLTWVVLPIAAGVAVFVFSLQHSGPRTIDRSGEQPGRASTAAVFRVVGSENVLVNARDEGVTTLPDGTRARRVRETYLATVVWKDAQSQASLKWTIPREEFRIIPVSLQ